MSKPQGPKSEIHAARLAATLASARTAAALAVTAQRNANALVARQHGEVEALHEAQQRLGSRSRDMRNSLQLLREALDRAKLTALNAGLEGARLGDPLGKALVVMGDEVRNLLARAVDALEEHGTLLGEVERERERSLAELSRVSDGSRELRQALARSEEQGQLCAALLTEIEQDVTSALGSDAETARALAASAERVQELAESLGELSRRAPGSEAALAELLAPLLALLPAAGAERGQ